MKTWNLLPILSAPMPLQMALDEILFRQIEVASPFSDTLPRNDVIASGAKQSPLFRIFFSSEPWVTVGYSTRGPFLPHGVGEDQGGGKSAPPVCRRITGGGMVHHGSDLIFSVIARKMHDNSFKSVRLAYLKIHEAVKAAFETHGLKPRFYRCDENLPRGEDCFGFPIATDLALADKKVAGGAQKRSSGALLHQESIQGIPGLDLFDLAASLRESIEKMFEIKLKPLDLDPRLLERAQKLAEEKYAVPVAGPAMAKADYERTRIFSR